MTDAPAQAEAADERELVLSRLLDATPEQIYRCWTEPQLIVQWFTPKPWETVSAEVDLRAGGGNRIVMRGPDGTEFPNVGCYLELIPNRKIVFTDAFVGDWRPAAKPFFTAIVTFEREGDKTRYIARARHWTAEDAAKHAEMGFEPGWGAAADQLDALAKTL